MTIILTCVTTGSTYCLKAGEMTLWRQIPTTNHRFVSSSKSGLGTKTDKQINKQTNDLTCDASALLGIIINVNTFPQNVRIDAEKVSCYCTYGKETKYLVLEVRVMVCFIGGRNRRNRRKFQQPTIVLYRHPNLDLVLKQTNK
jgi:hypothetical protein